MSCLISKRKPSVKNHNFSFYSLFSFFLSVVSKPVNILFRSVSFRRTSKHHTYFFSFTFVLLIVYTQEERPPHTYIDKFLTHTYTHLYMHTQFELIWYMLTQFLVASATVKYIYIYVCVYAYALILNYTTTIYIDDKEKEDEYYISWRDYLAIVNSINEHNYVLLYVALYFWWRQINTKTYECELVDYPWLYYYYYKVFLFNDVWIDT